MSFHEFLLELSFICRHSDMHIQDVTVSTSGFNSGANSESKTGVQLTKVRCYEHLKYLT
jgi:hypothetical protein